MYAMIGVELRTPGEIFRKILKTHLHTARIVVRVYRAIVYKEFIIYSVLPEQIFHRVRHKF